MTRGREWRHARKRRAEDFGIWKKAVSWDLNSERESWDLGLDEANRFSEFAEARPVVCSGGRTWWSEMKKSAQKEIVSLSVLMSNNLKLKKVIKFFIPELKKRVVFRVFRIPICLWTFVNVFRIRMNMSISRVCILVVYFWTWICYITEYRILYTDLT